MDFNCRSTGLGIGSFAVIMTEDGTTPSDVFYIQTTAIGYAGYFASDGLNATLPFNGATITIGTFDDALAYARSHTSP